MTNCACRHFVSKTIIIFQSSDTLTKGESRALLRKSAVETSLDHTGSAVLRKAGSGTGRPATASACAVCHCKAIFQLVGPTNLLNNVSKTLIVKSQTVIACLQPADTQ